MKNQEKTLSLNDVVTVWKEMYGEDFKTEYSGAYKKLKTLSTPKPFKLTNEFQSSSYQGEIKISYKELCEVLGEPNSENDGYKTDAEWTILFNDGTYATIYNWKDGKNYLGKQGLATSKITNWHIGGINEKSVTAVKSLFNK